MNIVSKIFFLFLYFIIFGCQNPQTVSAVVTGHPEATKIGVEILKRGGNAIDASVAVQLALAVCLPNAGNIGGGGFMTIRTNDSKVYALDFREKAPIKSSANMYLDTSGNIIDSLSTYGSLSVGVPGTIDGIFKVHERFGKINMDTLFNYAINLALNGFPITKKQSQELNYYQKDFQKFNQHNKYLQKVEWKVNDTLKQPDLANTLKIIRDNGRDGFYKGEIAQSIVETMGDKGIISMLDLENYTSLWREPIVLNFKNYKLISMPPPSSGGIALSQLIMMLFEFNVDKMEHNSIEYIHLLSEIEKRVYADRSMYLGDMDYYNVPIQELLKINYNKSRAQEINLKKATPSDSIAHGEYDSNESEETTHFSIIDNMGNAVSVTTTLNTSYGSKLFVNKRGFLLNNEMDDFSAKPGTPNTYGLLGSHANSIQPEKRMLSSMTPSILEKDNNLFLILGSPGGSTIITSVFQTILNVIFFNMDIQSAVDAPRFHHQWKPEYIYMEKDMGFEALSNELLQMGHKTKFRNSMGHVNAIMVTPNNIYVGADKRGDNCGEVIKK